MLNNVDLMGRLVADPELRHTASGIPVCSFTIACNRRTSGEQQGQTADFIDCIAWRGLAETIARYKNKGDMLVLSGRIETRTYEAGDGSKRKATSVNVREVTFCGDRRSEQTQATGGTSAEGQTVVNNPNGFVEVADDELPF